MKIDLHVHCQERSSCGRSSEEEQILAAIDAGLDAIVFTDHGRLMPAGRCEALNLKYAPFRIFGGIEVNIEGEHILVLGIHDPCLESRRWSYQELYRFVQERNGFLVLAHPFRYRDTIHIELESLPPDAIEVESINTRNGTQAEIRKVAKHFGIPLVCNSDSHSSDTLGFHYNVTHAAAKDETELVHLLRARAFRCHVDRGNTSFSLMEEITK